MVLSEKGQERLYLLGKSWIFIFLLAEAVIFSLTGIGFFSAKNFQNILVASTTIMLLAAGETFVIITGGIDLSVGFVMGLFCVINAKIIVALQAVGVSPLLSLIISIAGTLLLGLLPGLLNGVLVAKLKV
ncbi:MAG: hypothetical protein ABDK94_05395, partial [Atribacterota bacterium]